MQQKLGTACLTADELICGEQDSVRGREGGPHGV